MKTLTATSRLTAEGMVPAVAYKKGTDTLHLSVAENQVRSLWKDIKDKQEFTLDIEGTTHTVILQDIQVHVVSGAIQHMDFLIK